MADTQVAPRSGAADDDAAAGGTGGTAENEYDLPWRMDLPALRTLRVVRRVLPPTRTPHLDPHDPRLVLYRRPSAHRPLRTRLGLGPWFRVSTRSRMGTVAVLSAALGLAGSYGNAGERMRPQVNPVPEARVLGAEHWQTAAPAAGTWSAGATAFGISEGSCAAGALPPGDSAFRSSSAPTGTALQHVTRTGSPRAADALTRTWLAGVRTCARQAHGGNVEVRRLGTYGGIAGGLTVVGVFYSRTSPGPLGSTRGADLYAIGRNGGLVTTLELNVAGAPRRVPVGPFTAVAKRAVTELR
jgi:hypothetical protein